AICRAYNDWLHDFCQHSPDQLKMAAMLPIHEVNLACQELYRCVKDYGAVGAFVRPNYASGRYWHSNYWDPLYGLLQDLDVPLCFHEGTGSYYSTIEPRFGENRFMRHVASHSTEMQLALIALMLGGIFEFYPRLRVAFLEAQSWWEPGLLGRIEWDLRQHHDSDAPYLKLSPFEYWQRNCFSAIESGEREVGATVELLGGADNICVSSDFPHFDSSFPEVSSRVLSNKSISPEIGGKILSGGARLYGFTEGDFGKAAVAAKRRDNVGAARAEWPAVELGGGAELCHRRPQRDQNNSPSEQRQSENGQRRQLRRQPRLIVRSSSENGAGSARVIECDHDTTCNSVVQHPPIQKLTRP